MDELAADVFEIRTLVALLAGKSITDAAGVAGVGRQTVSTWVNRDPQFQASLNRARLALHGAVQDRARSVHLKALGIIDTALDDEDGDRVDVAISVLKIVTRMQPEPAGPTNAGLIAELQMLDDIRGLDFDVDDELRYADD